MENASKALLIAAAVLITLIVISIAVAVFTNMSNTVRQESRLDAQEIEAFNSKIMPYLGEKISRLTSKCVNTISNNNR